MGASRLGAGALALLAGGDPLRLSTTVDTSTDLAVLGGIPATAPILFSGPFVMGTPERLAQAGEDDPGERMGTLDGIPF